MTNNSAVRLLKNLGNYVLILSTALVIAGISGGDEKPVTSVGEFLLHYMFTLPVVAWGAVAVPTLVAVDWIATKYFRAAHRLILVITSAVLLGFPATFLSGSPQIGLMLALGGSIYGLAFRSIVQDRDRQ